MWGVEDKEIRNPVNVVVYYCYTQSIIPENLTKRNLFLSIWDLSGDLVPGGKFLYPVTWGPETKAWVGCTYSFKQSVVELGITFLIHFR